MREVLTQIIFETCSGAGFAEKDAAYIVHFIDRFVDRLIAEGRGVMFTKFEVRQLVEDELRIIKSERRHLKLVK